MARRRAGRRDADPNAQCLGEQSEGGLGNQAGAELVLYRLVRWLTTRRRNRRSSRFWVS